MGRGRPETVLTNYYGAANLGDAAIALATADALRDRLGRPPATVESWHPRADAAYGLFDDADVFDPLWRPHAPPGPLPVSPGEFAEAARKLPYLGRALLGDFDPDSRLLRPDERRLLARIRDADLVVSAGGGYLHDVHGPVFLRHLYTIALAARTETPVFVCGQSIGPFRSSLLGWVAARVLSATDYVAVRDPRSAAFLDRAGVTGVPVEVTADSAFLLDPAPPDPPLPEADGGPLVAATVRRWVYPDADRPAAARERYRDAVAACFDRLVVAHDATVVCLAHAAADVTEARRVRARCAHPGGVHVRPPDLGPRELKGATAAADLVVGTRMHSTVFATAAGTPTLCLSYLPKARTVMERLDLAEYAVDVDEVTPARLRGLVDRLLADREAVATRLARRVPGLVAAAGRHAVIAAQLVDGRAQPPSTTSR
jgi:colanic acid/amylovoran biosynthesis protein